MHALEGAEDWAGINGLSWPSLTRPSTTLNSHLQIRELAQAVLDARAAHPGATLADLYDPDAMPPNRQAHRALDAAVDRLYKRSGFSDDHERAEHLFGLYESLIARLPMAEPRRARRSRRTTTDAERQRST